jgi:hypothetical protein
LNGQDVLNLTGKGDTMEFVIKIIELIIMQCPALGAFIWFLVHYTKETEKRFIEQGKLYESSLNNIVNNIGVRIDKIDDKVDDLRIQVTKNEHV